MHVQLDHSDNKTITLIITASDKSKLARQYIGDDEKTDEPLYQMVQINGGHLKNAERMSSEFNIYPVALASVPDGEKRLDTNIKIGAVISVTDGEVIEEITTAVIPQKDIDALASKELEKLKQSAIVSNQYEAGVLIATLFGEMDPDKLKLKQLNALARAAVLLRKEAKGEASASEVQEMDALQVLEDAKNAIRTAENDAAALINAATDPAGVDAVKAPVWPE